MEANRELISAFFCVLHLPPMPVVVYRLDREDNSVVDDSATESSHCIIASMLEWAAMAKNDKANNQRLLAQTDLFEKFKAELLNLQLQTCPAAALYDFYCRHTRLYINTYAATMGETLRFKPLEYVAQGDKLHKNMQGYTKAQFRMFNGGDALSLQDSTQYEELLRKCAAWTQEGLMRENELEGCNARENAVVLEQGLPIDVAE
jgi:hypothetical protein